MGVGARAAEGMISVALVAKFGVGPELSPSTLLCEGAGIELMTPGAGGGGCGSESTIVEAAEKVCLRNEVRSCGTSVKSLGPSAARAS